LAGALAASIPASAYAQPAPTTTKGAYSRYEDETIANVSKQIGGKIDLEPEGKIIEGIEIHTLEVIEPRDPAPEFLNIFHGTTGHYVIDREVLQRPGERYKQTLVDETARNLARLVQLSVVIVLPFEGSAPDRVRVVVITKDVWSLRLNSDYAISSGGLERLLLQPSETNIFGTQQTIYARYTYHPEAHSFGGGYRVPRLDGRWLQLLLDANVYVNRRSGSPEGSFGAASIQRPLYSSLTEWAWSDGVAWLDEIHRAYVNAAETTYRRQSNDPTTDTHIPYEWRARRLVETAQLTRSFGWETKNDFSVGAEMNLAEYRTNGDHSRFAAADVQSFVKTALPVSDTRVGPFVQWRGYTTNFLRVVDFETLALQEDYRLGHDVWLRVYPVTTALGSSRTFLGTYAAAQYSLRLGRDGLARAGVESTVEAQSDSLSDAAIGANLRFMTPRLGIGRFVLDGTFLNRYRNYLNTQTYLGGDTRLRGFPTNELHGKDAFAVNVEFRSRPIEIVSCQLGGVAFFDVGDAENGVDKLQAYKSVGAGIRALFPQINRVVWRADIGFPIGARPSDVGAMSFFFAFEQAFSVTNVGGTSATGGFAPPAISGLLGQ
jgi:hemolysin activation/secretion protein